MAVKPSVPAASGMTARLAHRLVVMEATEWRRDGTGLIPAPPRVSGRRRYDAGVLDRLIVITSAQRAVSLWLRWANCSVA